jgi:hypothetical protein
LNQSDIAITICIGKSEYETQWPVVPRVGEVVRGYMYGTQLFSGRVIGVEHHFNPDNPTIKVRLNSRSFIP